MKKMYTREDIELLEEAIDDEMSELYCYFDRLDEEGEVLTAERLYDLALRLSRAKGILESMNKNYGDRDIIHLRWRRFILANENNINATIPTPPTKIPKLKPDKNELMTNYFGMAYPKALPKRYSVGRIRKVLKEQYNYEIYNITPYKGTRFNRHNIYRIYDCEGNVVVEKVTLSVIGQYLLDQGDY